LAKQAQMSFQPQSRFQTMYKGAFIYDVIFLCRNRVNISAKKLVGPVALLVGNYLLLNMYIVGKQSGLWHNDNNKFVHLNCHNFETEVCNTGCKVLFKKKLMNGLIHIQTVLLPFYGPA